MKKTILFLLLLFPMLTSITNGQSKLPTHQFGVGLYADPSGAAVGLPGGVSLTYAIAHNMQVGGNIGLDVASGNSTFGFEPFFRFLLPGAVSPYVQGAFAIISGGGATNAGILFGGGLAYGFNQSFLVNFNLNLVSAIFSNGGGAEFSFSNVSAGGSWFF